MLLGRVTNSHCDPKGPQVWLLGTFPLCQATLSHAHQASAMQDDFHFLKPSTFFSISVFTNAVPSPKIHILLASPAHAYWYGWFFPLFQLWQKCPFHRVAVSDLPEYSLVWLFSHTASITFIINYGSPSVFIIMPPPLENPLRARAGFFVHQCISNTYNSTFCYSSSKYNYCMNA